MKSFALSIAGLGLVLAACAPAAVPTQAPGSGAAELLQWSEPPAMTIDTARTYIATINVANKGKIAIELLDDVAPVTVNNFVFLARQGYYDGTTFHRVIAGFMAQAGDPTGTGMGGPGYQFQDEFDPAVTFDGPGLLAMANAGPGTNGSQFFITYAPTPHLNGAHTIFGRVTSGLEVALALSERDPQSATAPGDVITSITIDEQ